MWNIGSFQNRYGTAGKYDAGMYETYLFGRTHVGGDDLTANIDTGTEWGLTGEAGGGTKLEMIPFTNNQLFQIFKGSPGGNRYSVPITRSAQTTGFRFPDYLPIARRSTCPTRGRFPRGRRSWGTLHLGLAYKKLLTFGAH